jgi:hypothetical protein
VHVLIEEGLAVRDHDEMTEAMAYSPRTMRRHEWKR